MNGQKQVGFSTSECGPVSGIRVPLHLLIAPANVDANKSYFYILHPPANLSGKLRVRVGPPTLHPSCQQRCIKVHFFHFLIITHNQGLLTLIIPFAEHFSWYSLVATTDLWSMFMSVCMYDLCKICDICISPTNWRACSNWFVESYSWVIKCYWPTQHQSGKRLCLIADTEFSKIIITLVYDNS